MRLFISYAHVDWPFVQQLADRLEPYHEVWHNNRLHAGQDWRQAAMNRLAWADCLIFILSPESLASTHCRDEYATARRLGKKIVFARLQPSITLPDGMSHILIIDFAERPFHDALADLIGTLALIERDLVAVPPNTVGARFAMAPSSPTSTHVTGVAGLFPRQGEWTEDDYFALPETSRLVELVNGELVMPPAPDSTHQDVSRDLFRALDTHVAANDLGVVYLAPVALRLKASLIREPDVLFLRNERLAYRRNRFIQAPVDWVAEVISPGTRKTDQVSKLAEYAEAGIPEYWLVDPVERFIRVYVLPEGATTYMLAGAYRAGRFARSETVTGFGVPADLALRR